MKIQLLVCSLLVCASVAWADPFHPELPKTAKHIEEIIHSFAEQRGNGFPEYAHFFSFNHELLVIWNCPFSGVAATFAYAYAYDGSTWTLFYDKRLEGTHTISVQSPSVGNEEQLIIRSADDKTIATLALGSLPHIHSHAAPAQ